MIVEVQLWQIVTLLVSFFGCVAGFWKFTEARREKAEDRRWNDLHRYMDSRFKDIANTQRDTHEKSDKLERSLLELKAELPQKYLMREDYVRQQSVIETKLDALARRIESIMLNGAFK
ncbi:MAG: hypothetical protein FWG52_09785 [Proteobacteria bacterium]|jgi:hypothetical protein|nr:hypothetical protein [Pseudomonadota bacterium]